MLFSVPLGSTVCTAAFCTLTSVLGVSEAMTQTGDILSSEGRTELLVPMYLYLLLWFFLYCYPIARATLALEKRFAVK